MSLVPKLVGCNLPSQTGGLQALLPTPWREEGSSAILLQIFYFQLWTRLLLCTSMELSFSRNVQNSNPDTFSSSFIAISTIPFLQVKWCMQYLEIMPDKSILYLKQQHNRFIVYWSLYAVFQKHSLGRNVSLWLSNYHLYLFESWVFRNGLNQWNKKADV